MNDTNASTGFIPPEPEHLAHLFPGYQIIRLIACGGMGAVYEAVQNSLDRAVAIKILPREFTSDESFRIAFETEAKAMARLNHPNLIGVYDFGEVEGMLFIIMEYVPGFSLFQAANGQPILQTEVVPLVAAISRGLAHAHENGIIHRDIKPANILLNHHNEPKIGDFGLARPLERQLEEGEDIFGTPGYTAPEVVNNPQSIDHRADIFSLGVLLHELLTGLLPDADPRPASAICHCDPRFDAVIRKSTHPSATERYNSAAEIAAEIEKINTTAGPRVLQTASPTGSSPQVAVAKYPVAKKSGLKGPLIVILLIAIGYVGYIYYQKDTLQNSEESQLVESDDPDATARGNDGLADDGGRLDTSNNQDQNNSSSETAIIDGVLMWRGATAKFEKSAETLKFEVLSRDIHGDKDSGIFKSEPWTGDGLFTLEIETIGGGKSNAKAGLMIRETHEIGSRNVFLARTPAGETLLQLRNRENRETQEFIRIQANHKFLRIQRSGNRITAVASDNGEVWTEIGTLTLKDLASDIHVGFAAAALSDDIPLTITTTPLVSLVSQTDIAVNGAPSPRTNMNELFRRARSVMQERAKPILDEYQNAMNANISSYIRSTTTIIEQLPSSEKDKFSGHFRNISSAVEVEGHIAFTPPTTLKSLEGYNEIHETHLARQHQIKREHAERMAGLEEIYLNGLNSQIERSSAENDEGAVRVLEAEKHRLSNFPYYFRSLMEQS